MNFPPNQNFLSCITNIPGGLKTLGELSISKLYIPQINWLKQASSPAEVPSLFYSIPQYNGRPLSPQNHLALFDIDWTVTFAQKKLKPHWAADDIELLPNRQKILEQIIKMGYTLIFVTNQLAKGEKAHQERVQRIQNFMMKLRLPCYVFIAMGDDNYRKPNTGIWDKITTLIPDIKYAFYVGDALGRPQDFSDSDKKFAENIGIPYFSPEDIFPLEIVKLPPGKFLVPGGKFLVITVGAPGTGKSTYTQTYFPDDYYNISSDKFKSNKKKILKDLEIQMKLNTSGIVIDATNPTQEGREVYYSLAEKYGYIPVVLYFVRDGYGWNKLRTITKVPDMGYNMFFSRLIPPTKENTPGKLVLIN